MDVDDFTDSAVESSRADLEAFVRDSWADLSDGPESADDGSCRDFWDPAQAGHDFCLTRNGHGAGFRDRGQGARGDRLSDSARVYGEVSASVLSGRVDVE